MSEQVRMRLPRAGGSRDHSGGRDHSGQRDARERYLDARERYLRHDHRRRSLE